MAFVQEKGLWAWGGSSEPVVCHVLGGLYGGVRVEHSLGIDCLLSKLESLNCSPIEVLNYSEAPPSIHDGLGGVVVA